MTSPEPNPPMSAAPKPAWMPSRKALLIAAVAFVVGLLLFLALWLDQRDNNRFYRSLEAPRDVEGQVFEPLPAPLPAGAENASGMGKPEDLPPAPVGGAEAPNRMPPPIAAPAAPAPAAPAPVADRDPQPVRSPAPRYPREAQRRRESGTVLLRVHVGIDGEPRSIDLVEGSGSRSLDRAAVDAVRRWRFDPAMRGGQAVEGVIQVPITFNLGR